MDIPETPSESQGERSPTSKRADAERNRERILTAARKLYASEGLDISMAAVAREAGVGKATLFRHFTTPQQLIDAVFADRMDTYVDATTQALADTDPWHGFIRYITSVCEMQARDRGFADVLTLTFHSAEALEERRTQAYHGFLEIIERAKATGHLQSDFVSEDLILVLMANAGVISATANDAPDSWQRLIGHLLRGFANPGAPIPPMPPPPSSDSLYRAMKRAE
ncbi:TetR/AcrR family transcriptional regulator [Rhodococcus opacus]|uniref:TetR/AcrR family transcriptional regulator n=1 Tax=Rhodococcus opacus TaxID=37919 RepID=A0A2S8IIA3_RHOOP|nr:TetR/AcrR family transcriptional regulator [Rhodococcus opacus]PQP14507.1 TetR/AcrR family transcriptional regulator [Rhodococcus opacus]